jgi:uncharacterized LabA/DUF88 family protein
VIVSGDSDFSPLVSKLKENGKHVIGIGMRGSTSALLSDNCDEFIFYEDLERQDSEKHVVSKLEGALPDKKREAFALLLDACTALRRENHEVLYASMIKETMRRKKPSFDESYYGFRSMTHLLEEAAKLKVVDIERESRSRSVIVTRFGEKDASAASVIAPVVAIKPQPFRRQRRR